MSDISDTVVTHMVLNKLQSAKDADSCCQIGQRVAGHGCDIEQHCSMDCSIVSQQHKPHADTTGESELPDAAT